MRSAELNAQTLMVELTDFLVQTKEKQQAADSVAPYIEDLKQRLQKYMQNSVYSA